jgi:hypothetical protein
LFVCVKSPLTERLLMLSEALPVLLRFTSLDALVVPTGWVPKFRFVVDKTATGPTPMPPSATVCGLPGALSVMMSVPLWPPATVGGGVKLTSIAQ